MRIGIDARLYRRSTAGIGRYTRALIYWLAQFDISNDYIVFLTPEDMKEWEAPGKNFQAVVVPWGHYSLEEQTKFPRLLKKYKLDLIHYTNFNHPVMAKVPFVVTIHDLIMTLYPVGRKQKNPIRKLAYNWEMGHAAKKSKKVIVPSGASKKDVVRLLGADDSKVKVIYEGIDQEYARPVGDSIVNEIKRQYGIRRPYLLFVSQWRPHKGIIPLLQAYLLLKQKYRHDVELVLAGKMKEDFPLIRKAVELTKEEVGGVITPGFVPEEDLPALYQGAEAYVLPSLYEGFCLTHLEAMAAGVPVATSSRSCMPEILGEGAAYFDPEDPHDIARALDKILSDESYRAKLARIGQAQSKKYSWEKMARETLKVYEEVLRR